jgi:hypothetical protein
LARTIFRRLVARLVVVAGIRKWTGGLKFQAARYDGVVLC